MGIAFAGTNQNLSRPASDAALNLGTALTYSAWVRLNRQPSVAGAIFGIAAKSDGLLQMSSYFYVDLTNVVGFQASATGALATTVLGNTALVPGRWYHVAVVYDLLNARIYLNGAQDGIGVCIVVPFGSSAVFRIGALSDGTNAFEGVIADVRIYNRALAASDVFSIFEQRGADSIVGSLVARWPLNDRAPGIVPGTLVADVGPLGLSLNANNSPAYADDVLSASRRRYVSR